MSDAPRSNRYWIGRVRALRDRAEREREGVCFVEGIRQVLAARDGGRPVEAVLLDPGRLNSDVAWQAVDAIREAGAQVVELKSSEFERISARDNPTGIAAIVRWQPERLDALVPAVPSVWVVADDISDAGNLGTLVRTCDALGVAGLIARGGVDPSHPAALRASLGTAFQLLIATASTLDGVLDWCSRYGLITVATSASADVATWDARLDGPMAIFVGNEGRGLSPETIERCDVAVTIPMAGTATSLNVGVAAGIILYEALRQRSLG